MASTSASKEPLVDEVGNHVSQHGSTLTESSHNKRKMPAGEAKKGSSTAAKKVKTAKPRAPPKPRATEEERINQKLIMAGYENPERANKCVRAGLARGKFKIKFTGDPAQLKAVVLTKKCTKKVPNGSGGTMQCKGNYRATIRRLLDQPELGGEEEGTPGGPPSIRCTQCKAGAYVLRSCYSGPHWGFSDEVHFHCRKCPKMGLCHDYRMLHCDECDAHTAYASSATGHCSYGHPYVLDESWSDAFKND